MPVKKSSDGKVKFYEASHKYVIGRRQLVSVTTFLKDLFAPFDVNKVAKFKAMISRKQGKKGEGVRYWKNLWKAKAEHGTRVHLAIEEFILHGATKTDYLEAMDAPKINNGIRYIKENIKHGTKEPERIIYDEELGIAGQIDLFVEKKGKKVSLYDWKTNEKIALTGYNGAKAKEPINDMPDCAWSKYQLQLNVYAYMLERQGYTIEGLTLVHLTEEFARPMKVAYNKELVEKILNYETN